MLPASRAAETVVKYEQSWMQPQQSGRLRAAIMCRLSRDAEDSTSIATQEEDGRTWCRLRGHDVVLVTYDVGVSGSIRPEDRPGFGVIFENLQHIDVVVARSIDRFTRVTAHFAGLVEKLNKGGTTLADVQGQVDLTSPYGRFVTMIMVAFAQMERETIQARILRSRAELRQAGRWLGGAAPYGFRIVPDGEGGKRLEVDPEPAAVLRDVIRRVIEGVTLSSEVYRLNGYVETTADGETIQHPRVPSPMDYRKALRDTLPESTEEYATWTYSALWQHLRSEVLRGYRVVGKRSARRVVRDADGAPVRVGPALVDDETWFALQRALDAAAVDPRRPRRKATMLLHVGWDPLCEEWLYYNAREYQGERRDIYTCTAARVAHVRKAGPCPGVSIRADKLEPLVKDWVLTRFGHMPFTVRKRVGGGEGNRTATIRALTEDIEQLAETLPSLRGAAYTAVLAQLSARQEALEEAEAEPADVERWEWVPTGLTVADEWERRDTAGKRLLLLSLGIRADVAPARGKRTWDASRVSVGVHRSDPERDAMEEALHQATL